MSLPKDVTSPWSLDRNWRAHKSPVAVRSFMPTVQPSPVPQRKYKNFLDEEFDNDVDGDLEWSRVSSNDDEWVGGWRDFHL